MAAEAVEVAQAGQEQLNRPRVSPHDISTAHATPKRRKNMCVDSSVDRSNEGLEVIPGCGFRLHFDLSTLACSAMVYSGVH